MWFGYGLGVGQGFLGGGSAESQILDDLNSGGAGADAPITDDLGSGGTVDAPIVDDLGS